MSAGCRLTVFCLSYNFAQYIKDTFQGFLSQKTDFVFKVFVFDDASTDGTKSILDKYKKKYPDMFDIFIAPRNTYSDDDRNEYLQNIWRAHQEGEYVAECEGDDYWTDPYKLQKQVDYLDQHPECAMTVHAARWINYSTNKEYNVYPAERSRNMTAEDVIVQPRSNPPTASFVYRARDLQIDNIFFREKVGDITRLFYQFTKGEIYYFNSVMSVYRHKHEGSWSAKYYKDRAFAMNHYLDMQDFLEKYDLYTNGRYKELIERKKSAYLYDALLLDSTVPIEEYEKLIAESDRITDFNKKRYKVGRRRIGEIIRGTYQLNDMEKSMLDNMKRIVIFGCGAYSKYIRSFLQNEGYVFDGYMISDGQNEKEQFDGKPVWSLSSFPYSFSETVVFVGVAQYLKLEIMKAMEEKHISNIITCFWFE